MVESEVVVLLPAHRGQVWPGGAGGVGGVTGLVQGGELAQSDLQDH